MSSPWQKYSVSNRRRSFPSIPWPRYSVNTVCNFTRKTKPQKILFGKCKIRYQLRTILHILWSHWGEDDSQVILIGWPYVWERCSNGPIWNGHRWLKTWYLGIGYAIGKAKQDINFNNQQLHFHNSHFWFISLLSLSIFLATSLKRKKMTCFICLGWNIFKFYYQKVVNLNKISFFPQKKMHMV